MKAKYINEENFIRGGSDPRINLGIGIVNKIKKLLDRHLTTTEDYLTYKIISRDRIEIIYIGKDYKDSGSKFGNLLKIIKYVERLKFKMIKVERSFGTVYVVREFFPNFEEIRNFSFKGGFYSESKISSVDEGEAEILTDALNKYHGLIGGFEPVSKYN